MVLICRFVINAYREYWDLIIAITIDLPSLQSIQLGGYALAGEDSSSCSLKMQSIEIQNQTEYNRSS